MPSREAVDERCALAKKEGRLKLGPEDDGSPVGYWALIADPDGHTLEVSFGQEIGIAVEGTGLFARMLQHETGHLDGFLYLDRLIGRHARAAKRSVKSHGWGVPGLSWMPGEVPDPFGN